MVLFTYDERGYAEPGIAFIQLKASEMLTRSGRDYVYDLDIRDYNLWVHEDIPIFLVLFDATRRRGYWLLVQPYFREAVSRQPKKGAKTVRVRVPTRQAISRRGVATIREVMRRADLRVVSEAMP